MADLGELEVGIARLDAKFAPVLNEPVRFNSNEEFMAFMAAGPPHFPAEDEAAAADILRDLLTHYGEGDETTRATVRDLLNRYSSYRWVAGVPREPTAASFRLHVLYLSARNFSNDPRDESVTLTELCRDAENAGIEIASILRDVAALSSDDDVYGWGSMRTLLNRAAG